MTDLLFFDTETFCETPIKSGTRRYAEDAEIMIASYAFGLDGAPGVTDLANGERLPREVQEALRDPYVTIVGHNFGSFDRIVIQEAWGFDIAPSRIHDTMVQALSHGTPGGLDKLCEIFGLTGADAKSEGGKNLIQLFCKPRPKNMKQRRATKATNPGEWQEFLDYARQDIPPMQRLYTMMPDWNYTHKQDGNDRKPEYRLWLLDQKINDRGFKVDQDLARSALAAVKIEQERLGDRVYDMTDGDVERASQRDKLLAHLLSAHGVTLPDFTKATLEKRVNDPDLPLAVRELVAIRLEASQTSTSKYTALLNGVNKDGRLRGTLQFCGAARTGRWAGRLFQPQNMLRPTMKAAEIEIGITALKRGLCGVFFDSPITVAANAMRGSIVAEGGKKLVVADLSNIEGRVLAWLAGEDWKLQAFKAFDNGVGHDLYKITAGGILGKDPADVTGSERQSTGKIPELACGYQGAAGAFASMAALYGLDLAPDHVNEIVRAWRRTNSKIERFWYDLQDAMWSTVTTGRDTSVGKIGFERNKAGSWMKMVLPNGRVLAYAMPQIAPDPRRGDAMSLSYMGLNSYTRRWERLFTYGGKLAENATQATARDVIANGAELAEDDGYPIVLTVHDELLTECPDDVKWSVDGLCRHMTRLPWWADEKLPLAAEGWEGYRYRK